MVIKVKEWLKRYLPAEVLSSIVTVTVGIVAFKLWHSYTLMAFAATWAGNISYFGYILLLDVMNTFRHLQKAGTQYNYYSFLLNIRAFVLEFGIAEVLDSFLIRPFLMYHLPMMMGSITGGLILAKFMADITFYIPAILSYEFAKRHFRKFS